MTIYAKDYGCSVSANPEANRTAIQAAMNAATVLWTASGEKVVQDVVLPTGVIRVVPYGLTEICLIMQSGVNFRGDPNGATRLVAVGDLSSGLIGDDMALLRFGTTGLPVRKINVRDMELSMEEVTLLDSNQQVHLFHAQAQTTVGDVSDIQCHNVVFGDTPARWVTMVGNSPYRVRNTLFNECRFRDAGQSGFVLQRGCTNTTIQDFEMTRFADQAIDVEVSDSGSHNSVGLYILGKGKGKRSLIDRREGRAGGTGIEGPIAIALAGAGASILTDVRVEDVDIVQGRILTLTAADILIKNVTLGGDYGTSGSGVLQFERYTNNVTLDNVVATRPPDASGGRILNIFGVSSTNPSNYLVKNCTFTQYNSDAVESDIIRAHCVNNIVIENTDLIYDSPNAGRYACWVRALGQIPRGQVFRNVRVNAKRGALISGILYSSSLSVGDILVDAECTFTGCTKSFTLSGAAATYLGPTYLHGMATTAIDLTTAGPPVVHLAGLVGGLTTTMSEASPEGVVTAIVGSTHVNQTTAEVYEKTSGTGNTGWTL